MSTQAKVQYPRPAPPGWKDFITASRNARKKCTTLHAEILKLNPTPPGYFRLPSGQLRKCNITLQDIDEFFTLK